ncbi:MAG TPA: hypothetical protein VF861_14465 [Telluria sp.]
MAHKFVVRSKLPVRVKGELVGEDGKPVQIDFNLRCKRLTQDEVDTENKGVPIKDFIRKVAEGWDDVLDEQNQPLPFSAENLDAVMNNDVGMANVMFQSYLKAAGAVAKN